MSPSLQPLVSVPHDSVPSQPPDALRQAEAKVAQAETSCFGLTTQIWELEETRTRVNYDLARLREQLTRDRRVLRNARANARYVADVSRQNPVLS